MCLSMSTRTQIISKSRYSSGWPLNPTIFAWLVTRISPSTGFEVQQFAELIAFLKEKGKITDYNQVALLLNSVKTFRSDVYVQTLQEKGIEVFCPRAGTYFDQEEVQLMIGCFG